MLAHSGRWTTGSTRTTVMCATTQNTKPCWLNGSTSGIKVPSGEWCCRTCYGSTSGNNYGFHVDTLSNRWWTTNEMEWEVQWNTPKTTQINPDLRVHNTTEFQHYFNVQNKINIILDIPDLNVSLPATTRNHKGRSVKHNLHATPSINTRFESQIWCESFQQWFIR